MYFKYISYIFLVDLIFLLVVTENFVDGGVARKNRKKEKMIEKVDEPEDFSDERFKPVQPANKGNKNKKGPKISVTTTTQAPRTAPPPYDKDIFVDSEEDMFMKREKERNRATTKLPTTEEPTTQIPTTQAPTIQIPTTQESIDQIPQKKVEKDPIEEIIKEGFEKDTQHLIKELETNHSESSVKYLCFEQQLDSQSSWNIVKPVSCESVYEKYHESMHKKPIIDEMKEKEGTSDTTYIPPEYTDNSSEYSGENSSEQSGEETSESSDLQESEETESSTDEETPESYEYPNRQEEDKSLQEKLKKEKEEAERLEKIKKEEEEAEKLKKEKEEMKPKTPKPDEDTAKEDMDSFERELKTEVRAKEEKPKIDPNDYYESDYE